MKDGGDTVGEGAQIPGLGVQLKFFCKRVGISISALESRLQLPRGALAQHLSDEDSGVEPGLAGVLRISFPELDWVPGSPSFPGEGWRPRIDPKGAVEDEPRTDTERRLLKICRRVLRSDAVGVDDDFEAVGGTSLHSKTILAKIYDVFDIRLPPEIAASARTIAELAVIVDRSQEAEQTVILWAKDDPPEA